MYKITPQYILNTYSLVLVEIGLPILSTFLEMVSEHRNWETHALGSCMGHVFPSFVVLFQA